MTGHLIKTDGEVENQDVGEYRLSFALERLEPVRSENEEEMLIPVRLTILAVGGESVKVDTVSIHLLQTAEELIIMDVGTIPFERTPGSGSCEGASSWSLCRLAAIVKARLATVMATAKAHAQNGWRGCHKHGLGGRHGRHGQHKKHGHHRHHWRAYRIGHVIHQTIRFFIIPALLGVIGGLMASAVGMLVGQIIVALWIRFRRGGRRGNASQQARLMEVIVVEDEKEVLLEDDLPPQYEVPPKYQDVEDAEEEQ